LKKNNDVGEEHHKEVEELCLKILESWEREKALLQRQEQFDTRSSKSVDDSLE